MKKLSSILAILVMATSAWAEDVVEVTTWEGIQKYLESANRATTTCKLMCDIDLSSESYVLNWDYNCSFLSGTISDFTIDGNGHTIKNVKSILKLALLSSVKNATIKNLTFDNVKSTHIGEEYKNISILVQESKGGCRFENLTFNNCTINGSYHAGFVCAVSDGSDTFTGITVTNSLISGVRYIGAVVGTSNGSTISDCHVSDSSVSGCYYVGGISGQAQACEMSDCSFRGKVTVWGDKTGADANAGGLVGYSDGNSNISNCKNYGEVEAADDRVGGIVGHAENITITSCQNMGWIHHEDLTGSDDEIGGIVGYGKGTNISKCINTGSIDGGDAYAGGIAGYLEGSSTIIHCVNGAFVNGDEQVGGIVGRLCNNAKVQYCIGASTRIEGGDYTELLIGQTDSGATSADNYWISNTSDIEAGAVTAADLKSGKVAWHINNKLVGQNKVWGQTLTNNGVGIEDYPTPGGKLVIKHTTTCKDESLEYYNNYSHDHYGDVVQNSDGTYICTYCERKVAEGADYVTGFSICDAQDLADFSAFVNAGHPLVSACVYNDIDCLSLTAFTPIGSQTATYCGTFNGQGHRIKNLTITGSQNGLGLFGALGHGATIQNLILDASCSVTGTNTTDQAGIGGIAGCVYAPVDQTSVNVYFENCGNEANVSGFSNVGGILGGVYNNNNIKTTISCCYNTGAINAEQTSATLAGWLYKWFEIKNCWNGGRVLVRDATKKDNLVFRRADDASLSGVSNVYSTVPQANDGVITITSGDVELGRLCYLLNGSTNKGSNLVWGQQLESELHPTFSGEGVSYTRAMSNQWGTICLPFAIQSNDDVQLYTLTNVTNGDKGSMEFAPTDDVVPANTPCVFKKMNSSETSVTFTPSNAVYTIGEDPSASTDVDGWTMHGTYTELTNQTGIYFIAREQFWWAEDPITIAPFRAWFTGPAPTSGAQGASLRIVEGDGSDTSTIGEISADGEANFFDTPIYNIQGQRQQVGQKGLQIRGGRVILNY